MYEELGNVDQSSFYADVTEAGSLARAIQTQLEAIGSSLRVNEGPAIFPFANASVRHNRRLSQIHTAKNERLFLFDFWDQGVYLAHAGTHSLPQVAEAVDAWISKRVRMRELQRLFPFVGVAPGAEAHEEGAAAEVEWQWAALHERITRELPKLEPLVANAKEVPALRCLFPFTSLYSLCFSRCTGYRFSADYPSACPTSEGRYRVSDSKGICLGEGDAATAVKLIVQHLPPNTGPAIQGTVEDLV
jgi:hypothetical protein